jgi:hypothetical protein
VELANALVRVARGWFEFGEIGVSGESWFQLSLKDRRDPCGSASGAYGWPVKLVQPRSSRARTRLPPERATA